MTARVLVVGAANVDFVVATETLPGPGETVVGPGVHRYGGGKGANAAVAAARAGAQVRFCGAVGADDIGSAVLAELRSEAVDVTDVDVLDDVPTGAALIVVDITGENQIAVGAGANAAVSGPAVRAAVRRAAGWAGCVLVSTEITPEAVAVAVSSAAEFGIRCVLNSAPVTVGLVELLSLAPILTPNATELADLHRLIGGEPGASVPEKAATVAAQTGSPVVVTLGGDGALLVDADGTTRELPAVEAVAVRDTTGAGDTFNGVLATALAAGADVDTASIRGVTAASLSVAEHGARPGMPTEERISAALAALTTR